ncbi:MAG: hypothetical protein L6V90_13435 [Treponema succinifaciens]|nr:MAG: hypothetical protein L6V90_13435 [Treponema succinifaciens]
MDWIFDGIGTAIITFILGLLGGGIAGYKIGVHKKTNIKKLRQVKILQI